MSRRSRRDILAVVLTFGLVLLAHAMLIAPPGLFSHDELQRSEYLQQHDLLSALVSLFTVPTTVAVGYRPVGDAIWALTLAPSPDNVTLLHFLDLSTHAITSVLVYYFSGHYIRGRTPRVIAALVFGLSPLTTLGIGWSGAVFDRSFVLFAVLTLHLSVSLVRSIPSLTRLGATLRLGAVAFCAGLAYFSKETAVFLPLIVILACLPLTREFQRIAMVTAASSVLLPPLYLVIRLGALTETLSDQSAGPYGWDISNAINKTIAYFAFPLVPQLSDIANMSLVPPELIGFVCLIHVGVILLLGVTAGWWRAAWYVALYYAFLVSVILLAPVATHELYGSALAVALAAGILAERIRNRTIVVAPASLCIVMLWHNGVIQSRVYQAGVCQAQLFGAIRGMLGEIGEDGAVPIIVDPTSSGARGAIAAALTYTTRVGPFDRLRFALEPLAVPVAGLHVRSDAGCGLTAIDLKTVKRPPAAPRDGPPVRTRSGENLLRNSSFEVLGREHGVAANWEPPFRQEVGLAVVTAGNGGNAIQRIHLAYAADPVTAFGSVQQSVKADPGASYTVSVDYVYQFDSAPDASRSVGFVVFPIDRGGKVIRESRVINLGWTPNRASTGRP